VGRSAWSNNRYHAPACSRRALRAYEFCDGKWLTAAARARKSSGQDSNGVRDYKAYRAVNRCKLEAYMDKFVMLPHRRLNKPIAVDQKKRLQNSI
jgi:hypothetical protein